jgi:hypothetical protein
MDGSIWLTRYTQWTSFPSIGVEPRFPSTLGSGFLVKLNAAGTQLLYSTIDIDGEAIPLTDPSGAVYLWTKTEPAYGPRLIRSQDVGSTWESHDFLDKREPVANLGFAPGGSQLYATAGSDLVRSADVGRTWQTLRKGTWRQYALHPTDLQILFAGWPDLYGGLSKSADGGARWKQVWDPEWGTQAIL